MHRAVKAVGGSVRNRGSRGEGIRAKPSMLYVVGVLFLALMVAGCEVHIEGGDGSMVIAVDRLPHNVVDVWYEAKSDAGFGHYVWLPMTIEGHSAYVERDRAASGTWTVKVVGYDGFGGQREVVFEREQTVAVNSKRQTVVTFEVLSFDGESTHGLFVMHGLSEALLARYIDEFQRHTVPGLLHSIGLQPLSGASGKPGSTSVGHHDPRPVIHLYGTAEAWDQTSPCVSAEASCYHGARGEIHVNAWQGDGFNPKLLTEAYTRFLVERAGGGAVPFWFVSGLARNEAERVQRGEACWNNPWLERLWDEIRSSRTLVPSLASQTSANAFTYTAVALLLEQNGGRHALQAFFHRLADGESFNDAFVEAFGITPFGFQLLYEGVVDRERA